MRARICAVVCWCAVALTGGVSFLLLLEGTSHAVGCRTAVCQRIEVIRQRNLARRYTFPDPNYRVAINLYLNDLDRRMVYFEGIRRYYPTQESWDRVVEQTRQNYLTALESLCRFGTITEDDTNRATDTTGATNTTTPADAADEASRTTESGTANNATGTSCPTTAASERGGATGTCASNQTAASGTSGTTGQVAVVRTATESTAASADTSASAGTNASGQTAATAPTKRIIATLPNGHRYAWRFYPGSAGQPARIVAEGRLP